MALNEIKYAKLPKLFLILFLFLFPLIIHNLVRHNAIDNSPMRSTRKSKIKSGFSESNSCEKSYENISSGGILINNGHNSSQLSISNVLSSNSGSSHNNSNNNNYNNNFNSMSKSPRNPASNNRNISQNNNQNNNNNSNNNNLNYEQNMRDVQNRDSQNREFKDLPVGPLILPYKKNEPTFQKKVQSPRPYNNYTEPPMRERTLSSSTSDSTYCTYF